MGRTASLASYDIAPATSTGKDSRIIAYRREMVQEIRTGQ